MDTAETVTRYAEIAALLWKYRNAGVFSLQDSLTSVFDEPQRDPDINDGKPEELVADIEEMGPAFVKIGQSLSTRPDLVAPPYLEALSQMQDQCTPVPFEAVREILEEELGVRLSKVFQSFDEEPLAAASLGQVHRARLRDGTEVAVKVQRPGVGQRIRDDMEVLAGIARRVDEHSETGRHFGFSQWLVELRRSLLRELNYETEAGNLETLTALTEQYPGLVIPQPHWDFTSRRVLTMDYVPGIKVSDRSGVRRLEEDGAELARQLTRAYLDQLFVHGFVHVDPHPGNVLMTPDSRLVVLDLGMVMHLSPSMRRQLLTLVLAIVDGRGHEVAEHCIEMGEPLEDFDADAVRRDISQMVAEYANGPNDLSEGMLMLQMTQVAAGHALRPPPEVILLGKTLLNLEHLSAHLAPDLDVREVVHEHLARVVRHRALEQLAPSAVISNTLELADMARSVPRQLSKILTLLADNRLTVNVDAFDETRFASNLQKIANRVTVGLIVAALIVAAAMLMRIETEATLWGYPAFAMVFFLVAGLLGIGLVVSVLWNDREK